MNILITGQCTLHWGRMEFGNIGNYYIIEPFIRELYRTFPDAVIKTTFQMSERFCTDEKVSVLPMDLYYNWTGNDLELAKKEVEITSKYEIGDALPESTPYIDALLWSELVIDFSGDIWGDNANFLGPDRFEVGLLKNITAKNLKKKTVMLAGSPGPFDDPELKQLAKSVYQSFDLVTNREGLSTKLLESEGFDTSKTKTLACPAFLFEPSPKERVRQILDENRIGVEGEKPVVGFIVCGWNFEVGPFDRWPRNDSDYQVFAEAVEYLTEELDLRVCLMSHSNGFDVPPAPFELKHGRDYPIAKQLQSVLKNRGIANDVFALDGIYDAWETKAIVGSFDMLVSGRVHAAVAALSQSVPTVIIDYGHEPKAHKLQGFAAVAGADQYVADPSLVGDLCEKINSCWHSRTDFKVFLDAHIPDVKKQARLNFESLKGLF